MCFMCFRVTDVIVEVCHPQIVKEFGVRFLSHAHFLVTLPFTSILSPEILFTILFTFISQWLWAALIPDPQVFPSLRWAALLPSLTPSLSKNSALLQNNLGKHFMCPVVHYGVAKISKKWMTAELCRWDHNYYNLKYKKIKHKFLYDCPIKIKY